MTRSFYCTVIFFCVTVLTGNIMNSEAQTKNLKETVKPFPKPGGSYNIGTQEFYWIDNSRDETLTKDAGDKRRLMIQVWYPTDQSLAGDGYPYIANPEEYGDNELVKKLLHIRTNSILDAAMSKKLGKYPVIVFSHGMQMSRFSNTSQVENLVSHGYIVFGIDHTFFNFSQKYPDDYLVKQDVELDYEKVVDDPMKTTENMYEFYDNLEKDIWLKDAEYVVSRIRDLNKLKDSQFHNRIDLENMGMLGYSFGGITALQLCKEDLGIKAAVSYDGGKIGDAWKAGITQPFMFIEPTMVEKTKEETEATGIPYELYLERKRVTEHRDKTFFNITKNENYILTFSGTTHGHFNDMGLLNPQDEKLLDVKLCHKILNEYTLAFFDKYLKNIDNDLLEDYPGKYKEAKFQKK